MAERPQVHGTIEGAGGGLGKGSKILCLMGCRETGPLEPRLYSKVQDHLDLHGRSASTQFAAHYIQVTKLPYLYIPIETATAGSVGPIDNSGVTGTSAISWAGTALDHRRLAIKVVEGGTVGTDGITFKVSRDGGRVWGKTIRLGTATTYVVPDTGATATFGAGTLVADDIAYAQCVGPTYDADGLAAAFAQLAAGTFLPRVVLIEGNIAGGTALQDVIDEIEAYESDHGRHSRVICSARPRYPNVAMQHTRAAMTGDPSDVDFSSVTHKITRNTGSFVTDGFLVGQSVKVTGTVSNNGVVGVLTTVSATELTFASGLTTESNLDGADITITAEGPGDLDFDSTADTITRNIGSWVTDGFQAGMAVYVDGSANNDNNGDSIGIVETVAATILTLVDGVTTEANLSALGVSITGVEPASTWRAAIEAIIGNTPQTAKVQDKVMFCGGEARRKNPIDNDRCLRPASWPLAIRVMDHQINISPAKVALGPLEGWSIHDDDGNLEAHDERVDGGLLAIRVACLTTHNDFSGPYCALPLTLDEDNASMSRLPVGLVMDLACTIATRELTRRLNEDQALKRDGTMKEAEVRKIEEYVLGRLKASLLATGPEGTLASDVTFEMDRTVDLSVPGAQVPCTVGVIPKGYLEQVFVTVRVTVGS